MTRWITEDRAYRKDLHTIYRDICLMCDICQPKRVVGGIKRGPSSGEAVVPIGPCGGETGREQGGRFESSRATSATSTFPGGRDDPMEAQVCKAVALW